MEQRASDGGADGRAACDAGIVLREQSAACVRDRDGGLSSGITDAGLPAWIKLVLSLEMWAGRLEVLPVLVLPYPGGDTGCKVMTDEEETISLKIEVEEDPPGGRLKLMDDAGNELGHMRFSRESEALIVIEHTEVDGSLRGKHGGRRFFEGMVAWARETGTRIRSDCPFTTSMFDRTPSSRDVLE